MILVKQSIENYPIAWDFENDLPIGEILDGAQCEINVLDSAGADQSATMISDKQVSGTILMGRLLNGANGADYTINFVGKTTIGGVYTGIVYLQIRNP
ncbi:MAG: hypothetical protein Q8L88_02285 [Bacteroidota bacterium]|nr:hypothetical protein [Bacteroidota bacterium]